MNQTVFRNFSIYRFVLLLLVSMLAAAAVQFVMFWVKTDTAEAAGGGRTVFYKNTGNWGAVQIHYWDSNGSPTGTTWGSNPSMQLIGGTGANAWYAYTIPGATTANLLRRDGGSNKLNNSLVITQDAW